MGSFADYYLKEEDEDEGLTPSQKAAKESKAGSSFADYYGVKSYKVSEPEPEPIVEPVKKKTIKEKVSGFIRDVRGITPEILGGGFIEAQKKIKDVFGKKEAPKGSDVIAEIRGQPLTAEQAYLNTVESESRLRPEIQKTQNALVEEWLKVVKAHPQVLAENRPYSGAAQFISKKEWNAMQETVKNASDDELRKMIRGRLEANGWEELSVSDVGRGLKTKEIKDLTNRYVNQKKTSSVFNEIIVDGTNDGDFREAVKEGFGNPIKTTKDIDRKSTRLNSIHSAKSRMPSSA